MVISTKQEQESTNTNNTNLNTSKHQHHHEPQRRNKQHARNTHRQSVALTKCAPGAVSYTHLTLPTICSV
eukprot:3543682-Alexandrium_andersonii.AAC.1